MQDSCQLRCHGLAYGALRTTYESPSGFHRFSVRRKPEGENIMTRNVNNNRKEYTRDEKIRYFIRQAKYALDRLDVLYREEKLANDAWKAFEFKPKKKKAA